MMGGRLDQGDTPDGGSVFWLELPLKRKRSSVCRPSLTAAPEVFVCLRHRGAFGLFAALDGFQQSACLARRLLCCDCGGGIRLAGCQVLASSEIPPPLLTRQ